MAKSIVLITFVISLILSPYSTSASPIGVCYGMVADNLPPPTEVVSMYKSNQITRMRLYNPNQEALEALRGSGIEVLVGTKNEDLEQLASSYSNAENWVATNIKPYSPEVRFRYVAVGNEVIPGELAQYVLLAMQNLQKALSLVSQEIKVSTSVATQALGTSYPPSAATFSQESMQYMAPIAQYLNSIGAPLLANVYPYFAYISDPTQIPLPYALFGSNTAVTDGSLRYDNLFDAMLDALYASLEKASAPEVEVVVSETGWPSGGNGDVATADNAQTYNTNLVRHVLSSGGTPSRPGKSIETYLFAMFNENMKPGDAVEQHWGLFYPNKSPVYPMSFLGGGRTPTVPGGRTPTVPGGQTPTVPGVPNSNTNPQNGSMTYEGIDNGAPNLPRTSLCFVVLLSLASFILL